MSCNDQQSTDSNNTQSTDSNNTQSTDSNNTHSDGPDDNAQTLTGLVEQTSQTSDGSVTDPLPTIANSEPQSNTPAEQPAESQQNNEVCYDDELDEDFEEDLAEDLSTRQFKKTIKSFDSPKGLEESDKSPLENGPENDQRALEALCKRMKNMTRKQLQELMSNMVTKNDQGMGNVDFSSVSEDHRNDARVRLREKLKEKQNAKKQKNVKPLKSKKDNTNPGNVEPATQG